MTNVPFPVTSSPGPRPQEGAGRLINAYTIKTEQGARSPLKWPRSPGLAALVTATGRTNYRGFIEINGSVISLLTDRAVIISQSGLVFTVTDLGALSGSGLVTVAKNNAGTPNIVAVTEEGAFNLFPASAPTDFADSDLPQPNSVSSVKNYLTFTIGDGRIFCTDLNSVSVNSLSYTTAPGPLIRGVSFRDQFFAFGANFCQVYADAGLSPFPLELQTTIPIGIAGAHAVAGWEPGYTGTLIFAAQDDIVYVLKGYTPNPVSTEDVSRDIAETPDKSVLEASCYMSNGQAFWCLTRPGFWSWEYNQTTGAWNERKSYGQDGWRAARTVKVFSRWCAGDRATGDLFEISATTYKEGDDPLVWEVWSGALASPPNQIAASRLDVDMTAAVGRAAGEDPIEVTPKVDITWSRDGGYRFGTPVQREIGREGDSKRTVSVSSLGISGPKGFRIKLRVSDPVPVTLFGATISDPKKLAPK